MEGVTEKLRLARSMRVNGLNFTWTKEDYSNDFWQLKATMGLAVITIWPDANVGFDADDGAWIASRWCASYSPLSPGCEVTVHGRTPETAVANLIKQLRKLAHDINESTGRLIARIKSEKASKKAKAS